MTYSPSPEGPQSLRAVETARLPSDTRRSIFQHPRAHAGGIIGGLVTLVMVMVPLWQTWLERRDAEALWQKNATLLEDKVVKLEAELEKQRAANRARKKRLQR